LSGPLLAVFTLAFFVPRARALPVLIAAVLGVSLSAWLTSLSQMQRLPAWLTPTGTVSPMWFCVVGCLATLAIGYSGSLLLRPAAQKVRTKGD